MVPNVAPKWISVCSRGIHVLVRPRRWSFVALGGVVVALIVAVAVAAPVVRARVRSAIEARCGALVGGTCEVGDVALARDGAIATGIRIRPRLVETHADVGALSVQFAWWPLLMGHPQDVAVRASHVVVSDESSLVDLVQEVMRLRRQRHGEGGGGRLHPVQISVDDVAGTVRVATGMLVRVDGAAADWQQDGDTEVRWSNAAFEGGSGTDARTGACAYRKVPDEREATLECRGFATRIDVEHAEAQWRTLSEALQSALDGLRNGGDASGTPGSQPVGGGPSGVVGVGAARPLGTEPEAFGVQVYARDGAVTVLQGGHEIVELRPASFHLNYDRGRMRTGHVRFGAEGAGPAIEADLETRDDHSWRLDLNANALPLRDLSRWVPIVPWHGVEQGRTYVQIRAEPAPQPGVVVVDGQLSLEEFGLMHRALSHDPIDGLNLTIHGGARIDLARRRIETEGVNIGLNGVVFGMAGWFESAQGHWMTDVTARLPTINCDMIRRALPASLTGPVDDLRFAGAIGADLHLALDTASLPTTQLEVNVDDQCSVAEDGFVNGIRRLRGPFVQRVQEPHGIRAFITGPHSPAWVPIGDLPEYVPRAVMYHEDGGFYGHHGFDVGQIRGAIIRDMTAHRFVYGASTLTMQLAKNVFLAREKTLVRKLQEVVLTWYLERYLDKNSILEMYLNVVEFGPGIYGIGPAARFFFGREPRELSPLQAIYLATLLPNPTARFGNFQRGGVSPGTLAALRAHARGMGARGMMSPADVALAQTEELGFRAASSPTHGPLTQIVDVSTTDDVAQDVSAREAAVRASAPSPEDSPVGDPGEDNGAADETTGNDDIPAPAPGSIRGATQQ